MPTRISKETRAAIERAWPDILTRFADGQSLKAICSEYPFGRDAVLAFRRGDAALTEEFEQARRDSADALLDEIIETISSPDGDRSRAAHDRNRINALIWLAEKRDPDRYSQRMRADINVTKVDLNRIIDEANQRLITYQQARTIEGEIVDALPVTKG